MDNGEFKHVVAEFKGEVLARLQRMDQDRLEARQETRHLFGSLGEELQQIRGELQTLQVTYALDKGMLRGMGTAIVAAVSLVISLLVAIYSFAKEPVP